MTHVADAFNNPFVVDDETTPPMRSAFAVLNAERDDLGRCSPDELLERALAQLRDDADLATVYGVPVSEEHLREAADRLRDPRNRAISHLLDFRHHHFDLCGLDELQEAVTEYRQRLSAAPALEVEDVTLLAGVLRALVGDPSVPVADSLHVAPPELPKAVDLLADLA